jgi:hypothetical protein
MRKQLFRIAVLWCVCAASAAVASAQEFQKSYRLGPDAGIQIRNVSGAINISGHDGDAVTVAAYKEGRDREQVEVVDESTGNGINIGVEYPRNCNCDASVRFEVRVPRSVAYNFTKISTASGDISFKSVRGRVRASTASGEVLLEDVAGEINASTASGNVSVREAAGTVNASSASGDVDVEIARLEGTGNMKFSTASGDVHVRMPSALDAEVYLSSVSGAVKTSFPLQVHERQHGSGSYAEGRLGGGARSLRITSASGNVSLTQK